MTPKPISRQAILNLFILFFSITSFSIFSGLAGCDNGTSVKDTTSTEEGSSVPVGGETPSNPGNPNPSGNPPPPVTTPNNSLVQNVILMVGSGMGPQQMGEVIQYRRLRKPSEEKLALEKLMDRKTLGMVATNSYLDIVSDTASANSAMACGLKARNNTVGLDANGNPCETILERAAKLGKGTAVVSNAKLSQPGVAAFLAHYLESQEENEIAEEILKNKTVDVLLTGGGENLIPQNKGSAKILIPINPDILKTKLKYLELNGAQAYAYQFSPNPGPMAPIDPGNLPPFGTPLPTTPMSWHDVSECAEMDLTLVNGNSKRKDQSNLVEQAKTNGYEFVCVKDKLNAVAASDQTKLLGVFAASNFPRIAERQGATALPTLAEMTSKALEILDKKPKGFVLVVHDGLTHLAAQENDPGTLLQEGLDFDATLKVVLDYADKNPDTLLIVTGDHETAGFGFAYSKGSGTDLKLPSGEEYDAPYNYAPYIRYDLLMEQKKSFFAMTSDLIEELYAPTPTKDLDTAAAELLSDIQANTGYHLTLDQAKEVLKRKPGADNAQTNDFAPFYVNDNVHNNLLGRAVAPETSTVWAASSSTSTPVMALATGPSAYAERIRGFIDNTQIAEIIFDALEGK